MKTKTTSKKKKKTESRYIYSFNPTFRECYWNIEGNQGTEVKDALEKLGCSKSMFLKAVRDFEDSDAFREMLGGKGKVYGKFSFSKKEKPIDDKFWNVNTPKVINTIPKWVKDYYFYLDFGYDEVRAKREALPADIPDDVATDKFIARCVLRLEQIEKNRMYRKSLMPYKD